MIATLASTVFLLLAIVVWLWRDRARARLDRDAARQISDLGNDPVLVADIVDGRILHANPAACRLLGYGEIVIESAGQDQALRRIRHLPDPDVLYLEICELLFGPRAPVPGAGQWRG